MNPVRKRFFGDTIVSQLYTGAALSLLSAVHDRKRLGGIDTLAMHRTLGNGVELTAVSQFGTDEVRIDSRGLSPAGSEAITREFCVWGGDEELFSEPVEFYSCTGPTSVSKETFYMGGSLHQGKGGPGPGRIPFEHGGKSFRSSDLAYVSDVSLPRLDTRSSGDIGGLANDDDVMVMVADDTTGGVYRRTSTAFYYPLIMSDPMHGFWLGPTSGNTGVISIFRAGSGESLGSTENEGGIKAVIGGDGDLYFYEAVNSRVVRINLDGGARSVYSVPSLGENPMVNLAVTKSGGIWLASVETSTDAPWRVFHRAPGADSWQELTSSEGFGAGAGGLPGDGFGEVSARMHYDRITDAVCLVKASGESDSVVIEGAWIFNGIDCLSRVMPPFFRRFNSAELPPNVYGNGATVSAAVAQFYDGKVYIVFRQGLGIVGDYPLSGPGSGNSLYTVGAYKIGKLQQSRAAVVA